jgi:hypothetical protein
MANFLLRVAAVVALGLFATASGAFAATHDAALALQSAQEQPIEPLEESDADEYENECKGNVYAFEGPNLTPLATYQDCVNTCKAGVVAIEAMCRFIPDPRVKTICFASRFSVPVCIGFCGWYFGQ